MKKSLTQGFTLIELLVVIAIIGILAAVVLVAINPAERFAEANDSKVKSNVGQVATALESCYTANSGSYDNCGSTTILKNNGYLKQDLSGTVTVATATVTGKTEAVAYGALQATSATCASGSGTPKDVVYRTTTGSTQTECGSTPAP